MKSLIKKLRKTPAINRMIRVVFNTGAKAIKKFENHWPVSGNLDLSFGGIPFKYYAESDDNIVDAIYYQRHYHEAKDLRLFIRMAEQSRTILDIGANTGIYSVLCGLKNPKARIYSFEPNPVNLKRLKTNIGLNDLPGVEIMPYALGSSVKTIEFTVPQNDQVSDTSSALREFSESTYEGKLQWKTIEVQQITLDSLLEKQTFSNVDLIKLDVEGYEIPVLQGASNLLRRFRPVIQCEVLADNFRSEFFKTFFTEFDYSPYLILEEGLLLAEELPDTNLAGLNILFLPEKLNKKLNSFAEVDKIMAGKTANKVDETTV